MKYKKILTLIVIENSEFLFQIKPIRNDAVDWILLDLFTCLSQKHKYLYNVPLLSYHNN